jgi:hypothetical protein
MYHNMLKNPQGTEMYVKGLSLPQPCHFLNEQVFPSTAALTEDELRQYDTGLQIISEGKVGLMLCAGIYRQSFKGDSRTPLILTKPNWGIEMNILEYVIKRIKAIGDYGKC